MKHYVNIAERAAVVVPFDRDNPGDAFIYDEINQNRKKERWLILYGVISLALVAVLVTIRVVFF